MSDDNPIPRIDRRRLFTVFTLDEEFARLNELVNAEIEDVIRLNTDRFDEDEPVDAVFDVRVLVAPTVDLVEHRPVEPL